MAGRRKSLKGIALLRDRIGRILRLGSRRRALLLESMVWLGIARLALLVLPFQSVARHLGEPMAPKDAMDRITPSESDPARAALAREIGSAVTRAAAAAPFRAVCLQQAVAASLMLRRRGLSSVIHFGVATGGGPEKSMEAHAWLDAAGAEVTGYPISPRFTEIACFV